MKKLLSVLLSLVLLCACVPLGAVSVSAATYGDLIYKIVDSTVTIINYDENAFGDLVIPDTIEGYPVTAIGEWAFYWCDSLTAVTIPDSVITIGERSFCRCDSLVSVTIGDSVTTIGDDAFRSCDSLVSVTIGNSVTAIGDRAFVDCRSLISVTIPDSVITIGERVFDGCESLTSVTIGDGVTTIGDDTFIYCYSLTAVTIGDSVTTIANSAFEGCYSLMCITVDADNPNYSSLDGVLFDKNRTTLIHCPGGKTDTYTIPDSVTTIGFAAFVYCGSLTCITVDAGNSNYSSLDGVVFDKSQTTLIQYPGGKIGAYTIPDGVTTIGDWAFYYCSPLTAVTIPDSVTAIGNGAFFNCRSLTSVTIPDSVTAIGEHAFSYCNSLTDVYYGGSKEDRAAISISDDNDPLINATWHYTCAHAYDSVCDADCNVCGEVRVPLHEYDHPYDPDCNLCGAIHEVKTSTAGDVTGDGKINIRDLGMLQQYLNGWNIGVLTSTCDVNADGKVNIRDLGILQQYLNGWDVKLG